MSLIRECGVDYFMDRFNGSMFFDPDGNPAYVDGSGSRSYTRDSIPIVSVMGTCEKPTNTQGFLPSEFFKSFSTFQVPPLGWRQAAKGRYLTHFSRHNRSGVRRAIAVDNVRRWTSPATNYLARSDNVSTSYYERPSSTIHLIMKPEFTPLQEGLAAMRKGDLFSFALSSNIAIIPEVDDAFAIYFNTHKVGTISSNGELNCRVPIINDTLKEQL